jgi:hypothetical protein
MSIFRDIWSDLIDRKLWPVALVLVGGIVAVPVVMKPHPSTSSSLAAAAPASQGTLALTPTSHTLAVVNLTHGSPAHLLPGGARDPFSPPPAATSATAKTGTTGPTGTTRPAGPIGTAKSGTSTTTKTSASTTGSSGTTTSTSTTTTTSTPVPAPKPAPAGPTRLQAYHVALANTNASGGVNTIDPLERLSPVPSAKQPLLVYLGVLLGGHKALFAVQPGTLVGDPSDCIPGPTDCEIIAVAPEQMVALSVSNGGTPALAAVFTVASIYLKSYSSPAAADRARRQQSAFGARLLRASALSALTLFPYRPSLGAVVDLRNLSVSGATAG